MPLIRFVSFFSVGTLSYIAGYLLTNRIRGGVYLTLFMYALLVLYLAENRRTARKEGR